MQSGHHKHLLLVDPEGVVSFHLFFLLRKHAELFFNLLSKVRTKDRTFESVSHLINYHRNNILPIISAESVLLLKRPVPRTNHLWIDLFLYWRLLGTRSSQEQMWKTSSLIFSVYIPKRVVSVELVTNICYNQKLLKQRLQGLSRLSKLIFDLNGTV